LEIGLWAGTKKDDESNSPTDMFGDETDFYEHEHEDYEQEIKPATCRRHKVEKPRSSSAFPRMHHTPIDPVHWKPDLFDT